MWIKVGQRITAKVLKGMGACQIEVERFREVFPRGVVLPPFGPKRDAVLSKAFNNGLDVDWFLLRTRLSGRVFCGKENCPSCPLVYQQGVEKYDSSRP